MNKHWETIIFYLYCIHVTEKKIITENKRGKNIPYLSHSGPSGKKCCHCKNKSQSLTQFWPNVSKNNCKGVEKSPD